MRADEIFSSKVRTRVLALLVEEPHNQHTIRSLSLKTECSYAQTYDEVHGLVSKGIIKMVDKKVVVNREHLNYDEIHQRLLPGRLQVSNRLLREIDAAIDEIRSHKSITIACHHNADPDSLGSAVALSSALRQLGIATEIVVPGGMSRQSKQILDRWPYTVKDKQKQNSTLTIITDSSSREQLKGLSLENRKILLVDHHEKGDLYEMAALSVLDAGASSTALVVFKMLQRIDASMDETTRALLAAGMITDSSFMRRMASEDLEALYLVMGSLKIEQLLPILSVEEDISSRIAKMKAFTRAEAWQLGNHIIAFSKVGSFESACALALVRAGADAAFVFNPSKNELRISGRARRTFHANLADILKSTESIIDGHAGGHAGAASANGKNSNSIPEAKSHVLRKLQEALKDKPKRI